MTFEELTRRLKELEAQYEHDAREARAAYTARWTTLLNEYAEGKSEGEARS